MDNANAVADCRGTYTLASAHYLVTAHYNNHSNSKLYICYNNSGDTIHEVDVNHATFNQTVVASSGYAGTIGCTPGVSSRGFAADGFLFEATSGGIFTRYNISTNNLDGHGLSAGPTNGVEVSHESNFYISDSGSLIFINDTAPLTSAVTITTDGAYNPGYTYVVEAPDRIIFTDKDGSGDDQVYEVLKTDFTSFNAITNLSGTPILYLTGMSQGLYMITPSEITIMNENGTEVIYSGGISNDDFVLVRSQELNRK